MSRLPRYPSDAKVTGQDLNLLLSILDTGGVIGITSITNSGVSGDSLVPITPNVAGSVSPTPGSAGTPAVVRGLTGSYGIDNFSQSHTAYVLLSWTPNPVLDFIATYAIYYHKGSDPTLYNIVVGGDANSARINNLFPGNTYSFSAQAYDAANRASGWCPEINVTVSLDSDPPATPSGLTATATATGVYLTWTEVGIDGISNDLKQYQVAVSLDGGATYPTLLTTGPGNSFLYTPTTANQGTVFFKVATVDWTGNVSAFSSAASAAVGTILGDVTIASPGRLIFGAAVSKIVPGATSISLRNNADNADNLLITDAGDVTLRGQLTLNTKGISLTGTTTTGSTLTSDGAILYLRAPGSPGSFDFQVTGGSDTNAVRITSVGHLQFTNAVSKVLPGATSLSLRNTGDSADNLILTDAGLGTMRNALSIPPTSAGTLPTTNYGTVVNLIEYQTPSNVATITIPASGNLPTGWRHLRIKTRLRSLNASTFVTLDIRLNGDTGANYSHQSIQAIQTTVNAGSGDLATAIATANIPANTAPANSYGSVIIDIFDYNSSDHKLVMTTSFEREATGAGGMRWNAGGGIWLSTAVVTSITLLGSAGNIGGYVSTYGEP